MFIMAPIFTYGNVNLLPKTSEMTKVKRENKYRMLQRIGDG